MGLPLNTPEELKWDKSTLERRLKGARLFLGVYNETARLDRGSGSQPLPPELKDEVSAISHRLAARRATSFGMTADRPPVMTSGDGSDRFASLVSRPATGPRPGSGGTVLGLADLRYQYALVNGLCFCTLKEVNEAARRARVKRVTPPVNSYTWKLPPPGPENPGLDRCLRAMVAEVSAPRRGYEEAAALWAKGDLRGMLEATPPGLEDACGEFLWPGSRERTIAFQTALIAQALDRPGKVVAAARITHLVATDGILERLRAQGFTIADPSKPLED
jgi:hypothetical protein